MSALAPTPVTLRGFSVHASREGDDVVAQFSGEAGLDARSALDAFVRELHRQAVASAAARVVIDFRELEFMNSSCFKSLVTWLGEIQDLPPAQQYRVHFRSNPKMLWQRRSLHALSCLAVDLVTVEP